MSFFLFRLEPFVVKDRTQIFFSRRDRKENEKENNWISVCAFALYSLSIDPKIKFSSEIQCVIGSLTPPLDHTHNHFAVRAVVVDCNWIRLRLIDEAKPLCGF